MKRPSPGAFPGRSALATLASRPLPPAAQRAIATTRPDLAEHLIRSLPVHLDAFVALWPRKLSAPARRQLIANAAPDAMSWLCTASKVRSFDVAKTVTERWRLGDTDIDAFAARLGSKALATLSDQGRLPGHHARRLPPSHQLNWLVSTTTTVDPELFVEIASHRPSWPTGSMIQLLRHLWYQPEPVRLEFLHRIQGAVSDGGLHLISRCAWSPEGADAIVDLVETLDERVRDWYLRDLLRFNPSFNPDQRERFIALLPERLRGDVPMPSSWGNPADGDPAVFDEFAERWMSFSQHTVCDDWLLMWLDSALDADRSSRLATMAKSARLVSEAPGRHGLASDRLVEALTRLGVPPRDLGRSGTQWSGFREDRSATSVEPRDITKVPVAKLAGPTLWRAVDELVERFGDDSDAWGLVIAMFDDTHLTFAEFCDTIDALR